jgi:predicted O-methyltransferase YrrM
LAEKAREESRKLHKEGISVSLEEAYLISEQVKLSSCISFIELGSLTGYSALFLLRALRPEGILHCFEKDDHCASFVESLFKDVSGVPELVGKKVIVHRGDAKDSLEKWQQPGNVGGAFIDANKGAYLDYLNWIETHLRSNYLIIADNVFLSGSVWGDEDTAFSKKQVQVLADFNTRLVNNNDYISHFVGTSEGLLIAKRK